MSGWRENVPTGSEPASKINIVIVVKLTAYLYDCLSGAANTWREERVTIT